MLFASFQCRQELETLKQLQVQTSGPSVAVGWSPVQPIPSTKYDVSSASQVHQECGRARRWQKQYSLSPLQPGGALGAVLPVGTWPKGRTMEQDGATL